MGTTTILGDTYEAVRIGRQAWTTTNAKWAGSGRWWNNGAADDGDGRYYNIYSGAAELLALKAALVGSPWRIPTQDDALALDAYLGNIVGAANVGGALKTIDQWDAPNTGAVNSFGFNGAPTGRYYFGWERKTINGYIALDAVSPVRTATLYHSSADFSPDTDQSAGGLGSSFYVPTRLIRDLEFHGFESMDFLVAPEWGYEPKITPSLSWTKTASGLWRCLDDGAAFDAYDAEITVKVSGAVHSAWEAFIATNRGAEVTYFAPAGVRPFGPHIDCTTGVQVVIGDAWATDWRVGITADCYTLHIPMRYVGGYTPTTATIPAVVARKYPTPTWFYPTKVHATESGTATAAPRGTETQTTQVLIDNLDQASASGMVNWCLYQRGASFTYTPTAGALPFGVAAGNGPFTVRLIGWSCQKPKPNRWDMTLDFAREA